MRNKRCLLLQVEFEWAERLRIQSFGLFAVLEAKEEDEERDGVLADGATHGVVAWG